jgi:hypothetical protein
MTCAEFRAPTGSGSVRGEPCRLRFDASGIRVVHGNTPIPGRVASCTGRRTVVECNLDTSGI